MEYRLVLGILATILAVLATGESVAWADNEISGYATARGVESTSPYNPVSPTSEFSVEDTTVYAWLRLINVYPPSHTLTWKWYTPGGTVYLNRSYTIEDPRNRGYSSWQHYELWDSTGIKGYSPQGLPGEWKIEVSLDDKLILTMAFTIRDIERPLIQPSFKFSWQSRVINVKINPETPDYAQKDVRDAIRIWNDDQEWFIKSYLGGTGARYTLVETRDNLTNLISISFNATQTTDKGGYAQFSQWHYDSSGNFTLVECKITMVLADKEGRKVNDYYITTLSVHEMGHCLGLDHTLQAGDVMNPNGTFAYHLHHPSTLNLYAVSKLSRGVNAKTAPSSYNLPTPIQYLYAPSPQPLPVSANQLAGYSMARGVETASPYLPINRTSEFSVTDAVAVAWLNFTNVYPYSHTVSWDWYIPSGSLYGSHSYVLDDPLEKGRLYWPWYAVQASIYIKGSAVSQLPGEWKVDIRLDGKQIITMRFRIADIDRPLVQPSFKVSWPSKSIDVKIDPTAPDYAKKNARTALRIWNESQEWFVYNYFEGGASRYILRDGETNSTSNISIRFNSSAATDYWSFMRYTTLKSNQSGNFTEVGCRISMALTLRDGRKLNDSAIVTLTLYELGRCLGLGPTNQTGDLMNPNAIWSWFFGVRYPSTLNLYALSKLSEGINRNAAPDSYTLAATIPYRQAPSTPFLSRSIDDVNWEGKKFSVIVASNSKISNIRLDQPSKKIAFETRNNQSSITYVEATIPKLLLDGPFTVMQSGSPIPFGIRTEDESNTLVFSLKGSTSTIEIIGSKIIPEFPGIELLVFLIGISTTLLLTRITRGYRYLTNVHR